MAVREAPKLRKKLTVTTLATYLLVFSVIAAAAAVAMLLFANDTPIFNRSKISSEADSLFVSRSPSDSPSSIPSLGPSVVPTHLPSQKPSFRPSKNPSFHPSISMTPSISLPPTISDRPSGSLSSEPSISFMPTTFPIDPDFYFHLKIDWQQGYYWQENWNEQTFCMECCACEGINFSDDGTGNCTAVEKCEAGSQLWIQRCDNGAERFSAITVDAYQMIQVKDTNLCMERIYQPFLALYECDPTNEKQLWRHTISNSSRFSIMPAYPTRDDKGSTFCVTQKHHPKSSEVVGLGSCSKAHSYTVG
jgi:hypothetical protein